jgi:cell wall-associated NlpC family hydrolase
MSRVLRCHTSDVSARVVRRRLRTHVVLAAAVAFVAVTALMLSGGASADPSIESKQAQAEAILAEVQELDAEVGAAAERFNGANYELEGLTTALGETRADLVRARRLQSASQERVADRLRSLYVHGGTPSALEVILGARSLSDVIDRAETTRRVAAQDGKLARDAKSLRRRVTTREKQLAVARARQAVVVGRLAVERDAIGAKLAERTRLLASVKDEISRLEAAERARQAELQRQAAAELARTRELAREQQEAQAASASASATTSGAGDGSSAPAPSVDYVPPPADASRGAQVVSIAMQYLGIPYVWGAADPSVGFDCSGLTSYVFAKIGVSLPHYAAAQYGYGSAVSKDQLQPGDLVFFRGLGHMGMYIGGGNMIHAPHTGDVVKISPLSDPYYVANWVGARRVL